MLLLSIILTRTKRVLICLKRVLVRALAATAVLTLILTAGMAIFSGHDSIGFRSVIMWMIVFFVGSWFLLFLFESFKYAGSVYHRYDEDIIGNAFTGMNKKSSMFEMGMEMFHQRYFGDALEMFTRIDSGSFSKTNEEQGVLSFYRGRCYDLMGWNPNAVNCYENAEKHGFHIPELPIFLARCHAENGNTSKALEMFKAIMDSDKKYSERMRVEIGRMYIKLNDGENALKWFNEAIDRHECYANALGGAAIAHTLLRDFKKGEEFYRMALLNNIDDPTGYSGYYKEIQAAVLLEAHNKDNP
jgi:tetratricopeptide (TPR) repeat protein